LTEINIELISAGFSRSLGSENEKSHVDVTLKIFSVYGSPYICEQIFYILHMKKDQAVIL